MPRRIMIAALFVFALPLAASGGGFDMPADMRALMPAEAEVVLVFRSLDEADARVADLFPLEEGERFSDLLPMALGGDGRLMPYIDRGRPLAVLGNFPLPGDQSDFNIKLILPVGDPALKDAVGPEVAVARQGDYVSFTAGAHWPAAAEPAGWLDALPDHLMGLRMDMVSIIGKYRPYIEMGLGSLNMAAAQAAADTTGRVQPMSMEEAEAMAALGRAMINSLDFLDFGLSDDGRHLALVTRWGMLPGSPLSPGPQPDFGEARQAAGLLPADWDFISVTALSQTAQMDLWWNYYEATMLKQMAALDPEPAARMRDWYEKYMDAMDLYFQPMATTVRLVGEKLAYDTVMRASDPQDTMDRFAYLLNHAADAGMGLTAVEGDAYEVDGVEVRTWNLEFDYEAMMEGMYPPPSHPSGPQPQFQQMNLVMSRIMSEVKMAAAGDYVVFSSGGDDEMFADVVKRAKKGRTRQQKDLDKVVKRIGDGSEQITTGDLGTFLTWMVDLIRAFDPDEEIDFRWPEGEDFPFTQYVTVDGDVYGLGFEMDAQDLKALIVLLDEMEDD